MNKSEPSKALTDALGKTHTVTTGDSRIACLVPSLTELLFSLGLGDQIIARTSYCIHPAEKVVSVPTVGGTKKIKHRLLKSLEPSHVVLNIDENTKEMAAQLEEYVPNIIVTHPLDPVDNLSLYRLLGGIFNRPDETLNLCSRFSAIYNELSDKASDWHRQQVLYLIWRAPWMSISRETYISRTLSLIGWDTLPAISESRYPQIEMEDLLAQAKPELVLFSSEPYSFGEQHLAAFSEEYEYPAERLALIDGEMTSWYGNRAITGLNYLQDFRLSLPVPLTNP